jgi:hypothetical protein
MADKLKRFFRVVGHTFLAIIAAIFAGTMLEAFVRPMVGKQRYSQAVAAHTPTVVVLLLVIVLLGGVVAYRRWADRCAFLAWILPALWLCHLMLSRGMEAMKGRWSDPGLFFAVGAAYSIGAFFAAIVEGKTLQKPRARWL